MKAFIGATCILVLLLFSVILLSLWGMHTLDGLEEILPDEKSPLPPADAKLSDFCTHLEEQRLLLGLLYSHERLDSLMGAARRTAAAARADEKGEYALLLAELKSMLEELRRDLRPSLIDVL